jgi:hypothetical protein
MVEEDVIKVMNKVSRSDSIPEICFLTESASTMLPTEEAVTVSEFKRKELNGELLPEPMLMEDKTRFVLFPIKHTDVSEAY